MTVQACPPSTPITTGVVVFVPADFKTAFPPFVTVSDVALQMSFTLATTQLTNSCCSRVKDANLRETLLNLLTAHITALKDGQNGEPPPGIVGRVDKATEGSVSVSAAMDTSGVYGKDYYAQTQWGLLYWQATQQFRKGRYIAPPPTCADFNGGLGFGFLDQGGFGGPGFGGGGGCNGC